MHQEVLLMKEPKKNKIIKFFKEHKKDLYITVGILGSTVLCFFGYKFFLKQPPLEKIIKNLSLSDLKYKRSELHTEYMSYTKNDKYRDTLSKLVSILEKEIVSRQNNGKIPSPPSYPREHGGIYKPD